MLLPIFNESGCTDLSLAFVPQRRISVFSLLILSLFADIHKLMSSVDVEICQVMNQFDRKEKSNTVGCHQHIHDKKVCGHR